MDEQTPFISVVMPVYNVEKYLENAVHSILSQTVQDFELILVDDCSPDGCPVICDRLAQENQKIRVIHHEKNMGLSMARNTGMEQAKGKYIWFMDSDDRVDCRLFEMVEDSLKANPAQVVVFGLTEDYYDADGCLHHSKHILPEEKRFFDQEELRKYVIQLEQKTLYGYAWNKIYDRSYLMETGLKFEVITLIEDILFNVKYFMNIDKLNIIPFDGYHYNKRMDDSLTSKYVPDYYKLHRKRISLIYEQYKTWNLCTNDIRSILGALYTRYIFSAIQRNCDSRAHMNCRDRRKWTARLLKEPLVAALIPYAYSDGRLLEVMIRILRSKNILLITALGRIIYVCKDRLPLVFSKLKQKR